MRSENTPIIARSVAILPKILTFLNEINADEKGNNNSFQTGSGNTV